MQTVQRIFNFAVIVVLYIFVDGNLETFDISRAFLTLTVAKLSTLKNSPVFWLTLCLRSRSVEHRQLSVVSSR